MDGLDRQRISACVLLTGLWWWAAEESTAPGQVDQALRGGQRPTESGNDLKFERKFILYDL